MYTEKFELLEAKIRETAMLVARLREEKRQLEQENEQLRERISELEEELRRSREDASRYVPNLDSLLQQLSALHEGEEGRVADPLALAIAEVQAKEVKDAADYFQLGTLHEQKGQFEQAIAAYRQALELAPDHLDAAQRLAFLLEKLNRDAEASPLWEKIWAMREAQAAPKRRRLR